jgi:hypothetical protein
MIDDTDVFSQYVSSEMTKQQQQHVVFDPVMQFKGLNNEKMDNHLKQDHFKSMKPWMLLSEIIAIPIVTIGLVVSMPMSIFQKIILILLTIIHIIILTCLISYMAKLRNDTGNLNTTTTTATMQN